jgi:hypothetical protein
MGRRVEQVSAPMPKIMFVCEHREVEVDPGRLISDVARELGIAVCREEFAGTGLGDYTVWVKGDDGCVSPLTFYERWIKRCKGWRRMANRTRILGDCRIWTQPGIGSRLGTPRPLAPDARAGVDGSERFDHEHNAAGTAWNPYGHPHAVGKGTREAPKYEPKKKVDKKAAANKTPSPDDTALKAQESDEADES